MNSFTIVAGARPNFIKIAPIIHEINRVKSLGVKIDFRLVHTGQHYDKNMSGNFFEQLQIPKPNINLECKGETQAELTASIMVSFEKELLKNPADLVLVVGDVTSTMACAIVAQKLHVKVAHVEAGIRSGDLTMPEEINRIVTDSITDFFFTTTELANENLRKSGVVEDKIYFVGNTMIDTLLKQRNNFIKPAFWDEMGLKYREYLVVTLHRPSNVDTQSKLWELINEIIKSSKDLPLIFPVHPRTAKILNALNLDHPRLHKVPPLGYLEFNFLVEHSMAVITDSGGVTEETTFMRIPCLTLRDNTERPETITLGTNELVGANPKNLRPYLMKLFEGSWKEGNDIQFWDGLSAKRIVSQLLNLKA